MEKNQIFNGRVYETRVEVEPGTPFVLVFATSAPAMLRVRAVGAGVSAFVEYTIDPATMLADGTADFDPVPNLENGVIANGVYGDPIIAPLTAIRVTATGGTVVVGVLQ